MKVLLKLLSIILLVFVSIVCILLMIKETVEVFAFIDFLKDRCTPEHWHNEKKIQLKELVVDIFPYFLVSMSSVLIAFTIKGDTKNRKLKHKIEKLKSDE